MKRLFFSIFLIFLCLTNFAHFKGGKVVLYNIEVLEDKDETFSIDDVVNSNDFKPRVGSAHLFRGNIKKHWVKISFVADTKDEKVFLGGWFNNIQIAGNVVVYDVTSKPLKIDSRLGYDLEIDGIIHHSFYKGLTVNIVKGLNTFIFEIRPARGSIKTDFYISKIAYEINSGRTMQTLNYVMNVISIILTLGMLTLGIFTQSYFLYFSIYSLVNVVITEGALYIKSLFAQNLINLFVLFILLNVVRFWAITMFMLSFLNFRFYIRNLNRIGRILILIFAITTAFLIFLSGENSPYYNMINRLILHSFFILIDFVFAIILAGKRYVYADLFLFNFFSRNSFVLFTYIFEYAFGLHYLSISNEMFSIYDKFADICLIIVLLIDRIHISNIERAIDKSSDRFVSVLGSSGDRNTVFNSLLASLRSFIDFKRGYLVLKDYGYGIIAASPSFFDNLNNLKSLLNYFESLPLSKELREIYSLPNDISVKFDFVENISLIPLRAHAETTGYFILLNDDRNKYLNVEKNLIQDFSQKCALIIEHFNKMDAIKEREKAYEIYQNMGLFHKNTMHEVKIPLFSLQSSLDMVVKIYREKYKNEIPEFVDYLNNIQESVNFAVEQIEESLSIVGSEENVEFDINYIRDNLSSLRKLAVFLGVRFSEDYLLSMDTTLIGPQKSVKNVVNMIVKNGLEALEHCDKMEKKIRITFSIEDGKLAVSVLDNGTGIDEVAKKNLFKNYTQGKMVNSGQGLLLCKSIIERLGGEVYIDSIKDHFTKVDFTLNILKGIKELKE